MAVNGSERTVFLTGFPGFLGSRLIPRILERDPGTAVVCLVQSKFASIAQARVDELARSDPSTAGRVELVEGDLTADALGLDDVARLTNRVAEIWHLAAVYDLEVPRELGLSVNRDGTRQVLSVAKNCPQLQRFHYVSTCYVSGRWCGPFRETDLDVGQTFNNFYEETKFLAELEVARARDSGLPVTVYRPSIVVGDSVSGDTQKFDGPYVMLQWLLRQQRCPVALVPYIGDPTMVRFNVVPSDFVLDAISHLSILDESDGRTYHLADPEPPTVDELLAAMCDVAGVRGLRVRLPHHLAVWALGNIEPLERWLGIPASSVEYFRHPTHYDTAVATQHLAGSGIVCPPLADYLPNLVDFLRTHRDAGVGAMV